MRLVSIINAWIDAIELLPFCLENHLKFCDHVIVVWSMKSNQGNYDDGFLKFIVDYKNDGRVTFHQLEPAKGLTALANETRKRNNGIDIAKKSGFTHFLIADQDELYDPGQMNKDKSMFDHGLNGLVHRLHVYIRDPTLWCDDHTLVPGIHKLTNGVSVGSFKGYPFAYNSDGHALIDPSRRPSCTGIRMSETICHHYSYVRKDINLKINNSSANLKRSKSVILEELRDAKPGYTSRLYHQELKECPNYFGIET